VTEIDPKVATDEPARRRRRRVKHKLGVEADGGKARGRQASGAQAKIERKPAVVGDELDSPPHRRRVRRRVPRLFHLSSKRQQILIFVIIAIVTATALASMLSARIEDDSAYVPAGVTR
jgi:hypothetical protein